MSSLTIQSHRKVSQISTQAASAKSSNLAGPSESSLIHNFLALNPSGVSNPPSVEFTSAIEQFQQFVDSYWPKFQGADTTEKGNTDVTFSTDDEARLEQLVLDITYAYFSLFELDSIHS